MSGVFNRSIGVGLVLVLAGTLTGRAEINPKFTPVHLMRDARLVLVLKAGPVGEDKICRAKIRECLRPAGKDKPLSEVQVLDLRYARKEQYEAIKGQIVGQGDEPILLFSGKGENGEDVAYLHLGGRWLEVEKSKDPHTWEILSTEARSGSQGRGMEATWAGGTDCLLALVRLLIREPDLDVPVDGGSQWDEPIQVATFKGVVHRMQAVDLAGKGLFSLFVTANTGDKLFHWDAKAKRLDDITGKSGLASRSKAAAWGDFNADGRLDLVSFDGQATGVWLQGPDGTFAMTPVSGAPEGICLSLHTIDVGVRGRAGLAWMGASGVSVLVPDAEKAGLFTRKALPGSGPKQGTACLVADFDGDALADVMWIGPGGGRVWKGRGGGAFDDGTACEVATGEGAPAGAWLGDWNMDGRLDVFTVGPENRCLWQNEGGMRFRDFRHLSGELAYISKEGGVAGNACDINNDGRPDLFIAYAGMGPQIFFNRIFRSFGHAHRPMDLTELNTLPQVLEGQQAGVVADVTADGAQDMAIVAKNGELWLFPRAADKGSCLAARIALAAGGPYAGPVTVAGDNGVHETGAWAVVPGESEAFIGRSDAGGELTLRWQFPGGKPEKRTLQLTEDPVRFVLPVK